MIAISISELFFQSDCNNHMETIPLDPTEHEKIIKSWLIQWGEKGVGEPERTESGRRAGSGREKEWEVAQVGGNYAATLILCLKKG